MTRASPYRRVPDPAECPVAGSLVSGIRGSGGGGGAGSARSGRPVRSGFGRLRLGGGVRLGYWLLRETERLGNGRQVVLVDLPEAAGRIALDRDPALQPVHVELLIG